MDLEALAVAVDERVRVPAAERSGARLYGVRLEDGEGPHGGIGVELLAHGEARRLPEMVRPPAGLFAIALAATAWMAPMEEDRTMEAPPSEHRQRRRVHVTVLVGGEDGEDVAVLRSPGGEPQVLRGGVGVVNERLLRCWARRQLVPGAQSHPH